MVDFFIVNNILIISQSLPRFVLSYSLPVLQFCFCRFNIFSDVVDKARSWDFFLSNPNNDRLNPKTDSTASAASSSISKYFSLSYLSDKISLAGAIRRTVLALLMMWKQRMYNNLYQVLVQSALYKL